MALSPDEIVLAFAEAAAGYGAHARAARQTPGNPTLTGKAGSEKTAARRLLSRVVLEEDDRRRVLAAKVRRENAADEAELAGQSGEPDRAVAAVLAAVLDGRARQWGGRVLVDYR